MFRENLQTTSGLSILLHGIISLPDATSYDKVVYSTTYFLMEPVQMSANISLSFNDVR